MKQFIRKVSAVGTSVAMLGMTVGGAVAADLADMPAPFVADNSYVSTAMVIGSSSDTAARNTLKTYFDGFVESSTAVGDVTSSTDEEKIYVGENLLAEFSSTLDDGDLDGLWDDSISFEGESLETSEIIEVTGNVYLTTSGVENEEELSDKVATYTNASNSWAYRYTFDEDFNDTVTSSDELKVDFLGKELRITSFTASNNKVEFTTGADYSLGQDSSVAVGGHTVYVGTIFESKVEIWADNEDHKFLSDGDEETFDIGNDQVEVKVEDIGYTDDVASRTVLVTVGEDITTSVKDDDAVQTELGSPDVDDDNDDAEWNWHNSITRDGALTAGDYIGIQFHQKMNNYDDDPAPLGSGESMSTPFGYLTLDFDVPEQTYDQYTIEFEQNYDIDHGDVDEVHVVLITANDGTSSNEGISIDGTDTAKLAVLDNGSIYYEDNDGDWQPGSVDAGNYSTGNLYLESGTGTTKKLGLLKANGTTGMGREGFIPGGLGALKLEDTESGDDGSITGDITFNVSVNSTQLGETAEDSDSGDVQYQRNSAYIGTGGWDDGDMVTAYGTKFVNLESNSDNDQVVFYLPSEELYADYSFSLRGSSSSSSTEADLVTASEDTSGYSNLVLVGGPAVNSVTASFMGKSFPSYGDASGIAADTALVQLVEQAGQTALIVAGWETADTQRGASAVAAGGLTGSSHIA